MGFSRSSSYGDPAASRFMLTAILILLCGGAVVSNGLSLKPKEQFESRDPKEIPQQDEPNSEGEGGVIDRPPNFENDDRANANGHKKNCTQRLTHLKNGAAGIIESPNYPNNYPANMDCEWTLEAEKGSVIQATFFDVALRSPLLSGPSDSLYVTADGDWGENQRYSGDMNAVTPFTMLSITRKMAFRFKSTPTSTGGKGFRIGYFVTHREKPAATEPANGMMGVVCQTSPTDLPNIFPAKPIGRRSQEDFINEQYKAARDVKRTNANPFLVAMVLDDEHFCSGALIRENYVLTSAHCTRGVENIQMIFGTEDITVDDAGVQKRTVSSASVIEHPYYNSETGSHDLSLVKLSEPVLFTRFVKAARLPTASLLGHIFSGYSIQVAGWGSDVNNGTVFAKSRRKGMTVAPNAACRTTIHKQLNGLMMCSKGVKDSGVCQADAGSPMTARCPDHTTTYEPNQSQSQSQSSQQINQQVVEVVERPIDEINYEDYYDEDDYEDEYSEEESDDDYEGDDDSSDDDDTGDDDDSAATDEDDDSEADDDSSSGDDDDSSSDDDDASSDDDDAGSDDDDAGSDDDDAGFDDDDAGSDDDDDSYSDDDDDEYDRKQSKNLPRDNLNTMLSNRINELCPKCVRNRPDDYCYFRYHFKAIRRHSSGSGNFTRAVGAQSTSGGTTNSKPTKPQKPGGKPKPQKPGKPRPQKPVGKPKPQKPGAKPKPRPQKPGGGKPKPRPQKPAGKPKPQKPGGKPKPQKPGGKPKPQKPGGKPKPQKPGGKPRPQKPGGKPRPQKPGGKPRPQKPGGKPRPQKPGGKPRPQKPGGKPKPQKPSGKPRPQKPGTKPRPQKPGGKPRPQKPQGGAHKPRPRSCSGYGSSDVLLGIASFGSCSKGFVFSRITAYLDFLSANIAT